MNEAVEATRAVQGFSMGALIGFAMLYLTVASGVLFWAVKWLLDRYRKGIDIQFESLNQSWRRLELDLKEDKAELHRVEKRLLEMKADLPLNYVRKEDSIRSEAVTSAKLDALAAKIDQYARRQ